MEAANPGQEPFIVEIGPGTYAWCRCGRSATQPYCDGSHAGSPVQPEVVKIDDKRTVAWCACKKTKKPPFCDGTHTLL